MLKNMRPTTTAYSLLHSQNSAEFLRMTTLRHARYTEICPMNPLTGIWITHRTVLGYRHASPNGDNGVIGARLSYRALAPNEAVGNPTLFSIQHSTFSILNWTFTFSAKEKDVETGLSYFGSRYYSSDLSIWLSVDPMSDKYASLSPYTYCADNPVKLVDPNGEEIDPESLDLWNTIRFSLNVEKKIAKMCMQIEKETNGLLCSGATKKYTAIDITLTTMEIMERSSQVYKMSRCEGSVSSVTYNKKDNSLTVNFSSTSGFIHEITHCEQFEKGWIGFSRNSDGTVFSDIYDELEAYNNQAWYDPTSIPFSAAFRPLTKDWLFNIYDGEKFPYKNCGLFTTSRDSTMEDIRKAYPGKNWSFNGTISSAYEHDLYFKPKQ